VEDSEPANVWLFTDIVGSTRLWQAYPQAMSDAYRLHDAIIRAATDSEQGRVVSVVGDAFQAGFPSVDRALKAAIRAQRRLQSATWPLPEPLRVRMAIHAATEGQKIPALTIRHELGLVLGAAHGEQVIATAAVVLQADAADGDWTWQGLGRHLVRGMEGAIPLYQLVGGGLHNAFPPLRTRSTHPHNLPAMPADSYHERLAETVIGDHFKRGSRLVTLIAADVESAQVTGVAAARALLPRFPDGAFVTLVDGSLPGAVISSMGIDLDLGATMDELAATIGQRQVLLVLSGMETTTDGATELAELLSRCPLLHVIVAATEPLQTLWERVVYLPVS
jgi:hypothetical protein